MWMFVFGVVILVSSGISCLVCMLVVMFYVDLKVSLWLFIVNWCNRLLLL